MLKWQMPDTKLIHIIQKNYILKKNYIMKDLRASDPQLSSQQADYCQPYYHMSTLLAYFKSVKPATSPQFFDSASHGYANSAYKLCLNVLK